MNPESIAQKIKATRKGLAYTQAEFGSALGNVSYSTVSDWENGKNIPNDENLYKIARLSKQNLADFLSQDQQASAKSLRHNHEDCPECQAISQENSALKEEYIKLQDELMTVLQEKEKIDKKRKKYKKKLKKLNA